jgi:hypothetical protein
MNEMVESPFARTGIVETAGARQDQSRELADMQVSYLMAQQFPRDEVKAMDKILLAFTRTLLAEKSQYEYSRGGTDIRGASIKAMEAIATAWGNIDAAWRERSRGVDVRGVPYSEVEAVAVDLQSRTRKRISFIVPHWRDTRQGGYALKDERDIYELCASQAQRRVRACLEAVIPSDVVEAAMQQADATLKAKADTSAEAMAKMVEAFAPFGVTKEQIEKRIQRRLDAITPMQVVTLKRIYASLRDEMSEPSEWFEISGSSAEPSDAAGATAGDSSRTEAVKTRMKASAKRKASAKPDAKDSAKEKNAATGTTTASAKPAPLTYAEVAGQLTDAAERRERDAFLAAADLIRTVADEGQQRELQQLYSDLAPRFDDL